MASRQMEMEGIRVAELERMLLHLFTGMKVCYMYSIGVVRRHGCWAECLHDGSDDLAIERYCHTTENMTAVTSQD